MARTSGKDRPKWQLFAAGGFVLVAVGFVLYQALNRGSAGPTPEQLKQAEHAEMLKADADRAMAEQPKQTPEPTGPMVAPTRGATSAPK